MPPRYKEHYKQVPTGKEMRQRRLVHEAQIRRLQREQLFMGKRLRLRSPQESETESEYEFTSSDTTQIVRGLKSSGHSERMEALQNLSIKLEQPSEELRRFVAEGNCIDLLIRFLETTDADEKLQSLWCLTNIAALDSRLAQRVLPAMPLLLTLLSGDSIELKNQAVWALGNLAAEGEDIREKLHANGVLPLLIGLVDTKDATLMQTTCFAISNMARKPNSYFDELFALGLPEKVAQQLAAFKDNAECVAELAWVYVYLAASSNEQQISRILDTGAIDLLLQCATASIFTEPAIAENKSGQNSGACNSALLIPIVRTLGNIAAGGNDMQTHQLTSKPSFMPLLVKCIESTSSRALEKESLWVLSSVTATAAEITPALVSSVVPDLVRIVEKQNFDIKKEAAFSLLNISMSNEGRCFKELPNERLMREFVEFIKSQDEEMVRMGVQYVHIAFDQLDGRSGPELLASVNNGIDALENLMAVTKDDDTRTMASVLIDRYYGDDIDDDENPEDRETSKAMATD
ncbi:hypothetical protein GGI07_004616 [Coemansia sp. Benny D115]|nr:hypothetical protein GGI07_004616 [Coemansia sp. Benny D115]